MENEIKAEIARLEARIASETEYRKSHRCPPGVCSDCFYALESIELARVSIEDAKARIEKKRECPTCKYSWPGHNTSCPVLRSNRLHGESE